jgi:hypothetical protein
MKNRSKEVSSDWRRGEQFEKQEVSSDWRRGGQCKVTS